MSYYKAAQTEVDNQAALKAWFADRVKTVHNHVRASDILQRHGVSLRYGGQRSEQMFCPFHGNTKTQAAKYHASDGLRPDHVWCFVCNKQWDAIGLYKDYESFTGKFGGLLRAIERDYGITPPEPPSVADLEIEVDTSEFDTLLDVCERRLRSSKSSFDMNSYLKLGQVLDKLHYAIANNQLGQEPAKVILRQVLDKIGNKVRECPVD